MSSLSCTCRCNEVIYASRVCSCRERCVGLVQLIARAFDNLQLLYEALVVLGLQPSGLLLRCIDPCKQHGESRRRCDAVFARP
jgi:hypothetical protein